MKKEVWYLPVEKPSVVGWKPPGTITGNAGRLEAWTVEVLGPPLPAPPDLSPEARAVLEAAADADCTVARWENVSVDYRRSLIPPLAQARAALAEALAATDEHERTNALRMVERALKKMEAPHD